MVDTFKVLGQSAPSALTETALYTVPSAKSATISTVTVCNRSGTAATFRLSVAVGGVTTSSEQYLYYDQSLDGNSTWAATIGVTLNAGDVVRVFASTANLSFNAFGVEVA